MIRRAIFLAWPLLQATEIFDVVGVNRFLEDISVQKHTVANVKYSSCWSPENSLIFSYSNVYHFPLWEKQMEGLMMRGVWHCLEDRFAFFALDEKSSQLCKEKGVKLCCKATNRDLVPSDFFQNEYLRIVYLKWDILSIAQKHFDYVFYFDADVLLLQNPWPDALSNLQRKCDLTYQVDKRDTMQMNGGQILVRGKKKRSHRIVKGFQKFRDGPLGDQQIIDRVIMEVPKSRICSLDQDLYVGHCNNPTKSPILDLVSYHAICMTGFSTKLMRMSGMLQWASLAFNGTIENSPLDYDVIAKHLTFSPVAKLSSRDF